MWQLARFLHKLPLINKVKASTWYQWFWYTVIGAIIFVATNILLFVFRRLLALPDVMSVAISYALMTVFHFLLNNSLTFRKSEVRLPKKLSGHIMVSIINYLVGTSITALALEFIVDNGIIATALSTMVTFLMGFTLLNRFVYNPHKKGKKHNDNS